MRTFMYLYTVIHTYIYVYVYVHICVHTYICVYTSGVNSLHVARDTTKQWRVSTTHIITFEHARVFVGVRKCENSMIYEKTLTDLYVYICERIHAYLYAHKHMCVCRYMYMHSTCVIPLVRQ